MNEATAEREQTFSGQKLRPKKKAKAKGKAPATPEETEKVTEANVALAKVSGVLDDEVPATITVTLPDGERRMVCIHKCKARQIGYVMKFIASAFKSMGATTFSDAQGLAANMENPAILLTMISEVMDDAIVTACMLTDLDVETFKDLELDDALAIIIAVWTINQSFFLARILPMISGVMPGQEVEAA